MKRVLALSFVLFSLLDPTVSFAKVSNLSARERRVLEQSAKFRATRSVATLPRPIVSLVVGPDEPLANPGEPFQVTDVVMERLPWRRLIWAAVHGDTYVIHYEAGGIARSTHVLVATWKKGDKEARPVWHAVGEPLKDYPAFLAAIDHDQLDDDLRYRH